MRGHTPTGDLLRFAFSITAHHVRGAVISLAPAGISSLGIFESKNTKIHRALVKVCAYLSTRIPYRLAAATPSAAGRPRGARLNRNRDKMRAFFPGSPSPLMICMYLQGALPGCGACAGRPLVSTARDAMARSSAAGD